MTNSSEEHKNNLREIRQARRQAEMLRDQLLEESIRVRDEQMDQPLGPSEANRRRQGREAMRKAIFASNHAIASINQALKEIEHVTED